MRRIDILTTTSLMGALFIGSVSAEGKDAMFQQASQWAAVSQNSSVSERMGSDKTVKKLLSDGAVLPVDPYTETPPKSQTFNVKVLSEGLNAPDGLAVHPETGEIYVSEEDLVRISKIRNGRIQVVIDNATPIQQSIDGKRIRTDQLRNPEGIAFAANGDLYVVEDTPGGRLIRFAFNSEGLCKEGEVVHFPGAWQNYAWEGVDVGKNGEILMAGSDVESLSRQADCPSLFSGAIVYRDMEGNWWVPYQRVFSSFSHVRFSKSGKQAVYTCEITGEIGWLDLETRQPIGGNSSVVAKSPEGICCLPNGALLYTEEQGNVIYLDPSTDKRETAAAGLKSIESVCWDDQGGLALVTEDGGGRLLALIPNDPLPRHRDLLEFAPYHPIYSPKFIPDKCPAYLAEILALGGMSDQKTGMTNISLREFTSRVPLIAADARATPVQGLPQEADPVERVQFVVFNPNGLLVTEKGPQLSLAAFAAVKKSGQVVRTSVMRTTAQVADPVMGTVDPVGASAMAVPQPSAISVSSLGMATLHFLGMGKTPDYAISIDPRNPSDSYMVVFGYDGSRFQYKLDLPNRDEASDRWIVAYSGVSPTEWLRLVDPGEVLKKK
ncbi:MAG TPA: hypothetical protein DCZ95_01120 [Verrucomicrobia bacterium]|nr:MAG: hypothetical protein A2X46_00940 [Lentisphaerae bacterium GWF2_57_35]HBA82669.1 hypothetical protein [Verrucomicrobiota bacterium]